MTWHNYYIPPETKRWQGRADAPPASCFFQVVGMYDLQQHPPVNNAQPAFGLIGFCCDEGISRNQGRVGAAEGPVKIRQMLAKLSIPEKDFICYDVGDIICADKNLEQAQQALAEIVCLLLQHGITPIVMGGGHELAWGHYQGIAKKFPQEELGIINFDAHFDMRPLLPDNKGSSGTPFLQIARSHTMSVRRFDYNCIGIQRAANIPLLFATAESYHAQILLAEDLHAKTSAATKFIEHIIKRNQIIYLSLCLDVFATPYAPGVSAPQIVGLTPWQVLPLIRQLAMSGKVISYDIAELSPKYDIDERTAKLAANFIYEIIRYHKNSEHGCQPSLA